MLLNVVINTVWIVGGGERSLAWMYEQQLHDARTSGGDILISIPHTHKFSERWLVSTFLNNRIPFQRPIWEFSAGQPIDITRNIAVSHALRSSCRYLLFIDSDTLMPPQCVENLVAARMPIVSATYRARGPPHNVIANRRGIPITMEEVEQAAKSPNPLVSVDDVGMGCALIDTRVFKAVGQTLNEWRCFKPHPMGMLPNGKEYFVCDTKTAVSNSYMCSFCGGLLIARFFWMRIGMQNIDALSEDYWFCKMAKQHGFPVMVHSRVFANHESQFTEVGPQGLITSLRSAGDVT